MKKGGCNDEKPKDEGIEACSIEGGIRKRHGSALAKVMKSRERICRYISVFE